MSFLMKHYLKLSQAFLNVYLKSCHNSGSVALLPNKYIVPCLYKKMDNRSLTPRSETEVLKRPLDLEEANETWVKRIQLHPVLEEDSPDDADYVRRKLRKYVLLISYSGKGYLGMQRNPGAKTIEDELLGAMLKALLIKEEALSCPQVNRFQRAARTDKGVSAAKQIISVKIPDDVDIPEVINEHLSEQIRVMKAVRVTQKFDAKLMCDARSYSYLTPTFSFAPITAITDENYRISPEVLSELRSILQMYKGTHNFHNFTCRVKHSDRSAKRYIIDIDCSEPFIRNGMEWTLIKVKGQSFMMHQIRKMVGLAMAICKGFSSKSVFDKIWNREKIDIPIAPGLGLVLEEPHYDFYNKKYDDGVHELLQWDSVEDKIQAFREKYIDAEIIGTEIKEKCTIGWLQTLSLHTFDYRALDGEQHDNTEGNNGIIKAVRTLKWFRKDSEESKSPLEGSVTQTDSENPSPSGGLDLVQTEQQSCNGQNINSDLK